MKTTLVLCTHNRPIQPETRQALVTLERAGAHFVDHAGAPSDVTLARNLGLSAVHRGLVSFPDRFDLVLLVDDDMVFTLADVERLARAARATGFAVSAMYANELGQLCAARLTNGLWATGLGLLAVPAVQLSELALASETFVYQGEQHYGFTSSSAQRGHYWSEDFTLCRRLGGVSLLDVAVGHRKQVTIYPSPATVERVRLNPITRDASDGVLDFALQTDPETLQNGPTLENASKA